MIKFIKRILEITFLVFLFKKFYPEAKSKYDNTKREYEVNQKLDMIMELLEVKEKITNDDVQNVLGVSDKTAENYLNQLEDQKLIKQIGSVGRGVYYQKMGN